MLHVHVHAFTPTWVVHAHRYEEVDSSLRPRLERAERAKATHLIGEGHPEIAKALNAT